MFKASIRLSIALPAYCPAAFAQSLTFTHLAGSVGGAGYVDGTGTAARFLMPTGSGNAYVVI